MLPALQLQSEILDVEQYEALPEDVRVEVFEGIIYDMASSSEVHQTISTELTTMLNNYIKSRNGDCKLVKRMNRRIVMRDVKRIVGVLNRELKADIKLGFHSYNNQQLSFALSMYFIELLDQTKRGMYCRFQFMRHGAGRWECNNRIDGGLSESEMEV